MLGIFKLPAALPEGLTLGIKDAAGVTVPFAQLFTDQAMTIPFTANPTTIAASGEFYFYATSGWYQVILGGAGSAADLAWNEGAAKTFPLAPVNDPDDFATAAQGALADSALQPGDQVAVGTVSTFYLDSSVTISDNQFLSPAPSTYPEEVDTVSCDTDVNGGVSFIERFISGPLGATTIPAGNWTFHTWGAASAITGDNYIHTRINKRCEQSGMTGTFTGAGATRTFTVTGGTPFVAGDANTSILLASLIETPTQTAWISGYTSASVVTVTLTDPAFVNVAGVELRAIYYLLFGQQSDDLTAAGVVQEMSNTYIQVAPITGLMQTDRIVAVYFGRTTSNVARNISIYHGGSTRYSHIETPLLGNLITQTITDGATTTAPSEDAVFNAFTAGLNRQLVAATGDEVAYTLDYTVNKATSGGDTGLLIKMTDTASPGVSRPLEIKVNNVTVLSISPSGFAALGGVSCGSITSTGAHQTTVANPGTIGAYNYLGSITATTNQNISRLSPTYNQTSGTAANTDLLINRTETAVGSGTQRLIDAQVGSTSLFNVSNKGATTTKALIANARLVTDANATLAVDDHTLRMSTGAVGRTVNLSAAVVGQIIVVKKIDSGAGAVTFVSGTSCTIDGSTTRSLAAQYESFTLQCVTAGASCVFDII